MSHTYLSKATNRKTTPQSQPIPGKAQVKNSAGGYVFKLDDWKRLERFLILGSESPTYYASSRKLTAENVTCLENCLKQDAERFIRTIRDISACGRAPSNDPALLALALASSLGSAEVKAQIGAVLPQIARTGTHLFHFIQFTDGMRGWGRGLRNAIADWYYAHPIDQRAYQMIKYQSRDGWSHRDVLRQAHVKPRSDDYANLFAYVVGKPFERAALPLQVEAFETLKSITTPPNASKSEVANAIKLIVDNELPRECVPTEWLNLPEVWEALLEKMPYMAMIRNLGKMSNVGLLRHLSKATAKVVDRLGDVEALRKARVHPVQVLMALSTYRSGAGLRGSLSWSPEKPIVGALNAAFYSAFTAVEPTGKRFYIGLDISGSMDGGHVAGTNLTPREVGAVLSMVTMRTEKRYHAIGFTTNDSLTPLPISPEMDLETVVRRCQCLPMGGTDCALPMLDALRAKMEVDCFIVITDNETWAGSTHPSQALVKYRKAMGIDAKMVVMGLTSTGFSIADPSDGGMLDVVGFDSAAPAVIADFVTGGKNNTAVEDD